MLAYIKKLALHPWLLMSNTSLQRKQDIGLITKEEEMILNEQKRQELQAMERVGAGIQTRRGKKENPKTVTKKVEEKENKSVEP